LFASVLLFINHRRRLPALAAPLIVLASIAMGGCGGGSSPQSTQGTPAGTYTATVTATSGSLNHTTTLTIIVQ
jgi:hypothetical protein